MDTAHWPQEIAMKPMEEILAQNNTNSFSKPSSNPSSLERKTKPQKESSNCPRCNSTDTKFCYYNNYSLSQPRYFCKTCRRYWTEGGSLRNVPVGGGSRKNKRPSSSSSSSYSSISKKPPDLVVPITTPQLSQNPRIHHEHGQDLNLGFPSSNEFKSFSELIQAPNFDVSKNTTKGMMNSFMPIPNPDPNSVYSSSGELMIPMPEFKIPSLSFSLDGMGGTYGSSVHENSSGRLLFPFEDLKTSSTITTAHDAHHNGEQNRDHNGDTNGYWSGMLGGVSW